MHGRFHSRPDLDGLIVDTDVMMTQESLCMNVGVVTELRVPMVAVSCL